MKLWPPKPMTIFLILIVANFAVATGVTAFARLSPSWNTILDAGVCWLLLWLQVNNVLTFKERRQMLIEIIAAEDVERLLRYDRVPSARHLLARLTFSDPFKLYEP